MWTEAIARVKKIIGDSKAILVMNGDATEGSHHKNGSELLVDDIERHTAMAAECLKSFVEMCEKTFVVRGTECHTLRMEDLLAEKLNAEGMEARDKWLIEVNGCLVDAAHHMPVSGRAYLEASALSIVMGNARLNYVRANQRVPNVFLRGHRHCGGHYNDGSGLIAVTGAFQMLTRHGHKVVTDSIPRPQVNVLDWRGRDPGQLPAVHEITFNPPQHEIRKV